MAKNKINIESFLKQKEHWRKKVKKMGKSVEGLFELFILAEYNLVFFQKEASKMLEKAKEHIKKTKIKPEKQKEFDYQVIELEKKHLEVVADFLSKDREKRINNLIKFLSPFKKNSQRIEKSGGFGKKNAIINNREG